MTPRRTWAASAGVASVAFVATGLIVHPTVAIGPHATGSTDGAIRAWPHTCLELGVATRTDPGGHRRDLTARRVACRIALDRGRAQAGSGCVSGLLLHLHCPIADGPHVGLMPGGVVVVAAALSAAFAPRAIDRPYPDRPEPPLALEWLRDRAGPVVRARVVDVAAWHRSRRTDRRATLAGQQDHSAFEIAERLGEHVGHPVHAGAFTRMSTSTASRSSRRQPDRQLWRRGPG